MEEYNHTFYCYKYSIQNCTCREKVEMACLFFFFLQRLSREKDLLYLHLHKGEENNLVLKDEV